jgi:ribonuclease HI
MKVYFDGGCRPNPGTMELAVVIGGVAEVVRDIGPGTSMQAEWLALLHALRRAQAAGIAEPVLLGDSLPVVEQAHRRARCPADCSAHLAAFEVLAGATPGFRLHYVKRTQNLAGIALARSHGL